MYLRLIQRDGRNGMSSSPSPPSSSWAWHLKTEIIPGGGLISLPSLFSGRRKQRKSRNKGIVLVSAAAATPISISNAETKDRLELKRLFREAYERCHASPTEGLSFTLQDFLAALDSYDFDPQIGSRVKGTVLSIDVSGALVDITAKLSPAYLPVEEVCIRRIKNVEEAGIFPGLTEEFVVIGSNEADNSLILSLRSIQYELAWERCRQLQAQDVVLNGKVVSLNHGGVVAVVEGLRGFVPVSQISTKATAEVLLGKTLPLKFVEVAEEQSRLVLSNRKAIASSQAHIVIGSVVIGTVQSLKPYGVFVDVCGINGLLHISQISHGYISDIATLLQPGDTLKVMILSHDREKGRVSLSTKNLEPIHGDMIRNPKLVFEKAEEMAEKFRQQLAQAEAMARAECLDSA